MRAVLLLLLLALVLVAGCGEDEEAARPAAGAATELIIAVDPDGKGPERARIHRLRCPGSSGCDVVARVPAEAYAPVPSDRACTQQFGGQETARVSGRLDGRPVSGSFSRENGCEIDRWQQAAPLLALTGVRVR